jgi:hypothetical protein
MTGEQPFHHLFETLGHLPASHADAINRSAYEALHATLVVPLEHAGRGVMLSAPRAGYGKTHLLSHLQHHLASSHEFIPLLPVAGSRIDAVSVTEDTLRCLGQPLPAGGGLCRLDLIARRLFALALQPLVISGEVPCLDREAALDSLRDRPVETFDFHHPTAVTARWVHENFEVLGPRLAMELAQLTGSPPRAVAVWVDALFRFAATPLDAPGRLDALAQAAQFASPNAGAAMERLAALLALLSQFVRVVLVADELEGFSADETAALQLAAFLCSLRTSAGRVEVILSLNRDIWNSAFVPRLSSGLADRLTEVAIELEALTEEHMVALLDSRVPGLGARMLESVRSAGLEPYARGLLRAAGVAWQRTQQDPPTATETESPFAYATPAPTTDPAPMTSRPEPEPEPAPVAEVSAVATAVTPPAAIPASAAPQPAPELPPVQAEPPTQGEPAPSPFGDVPAAPRWRTPISRDLPHPPQFSPLSQPPAPVQVPAPSAIPSPESPTPPAQPVPAAVGDHEESPGWPQFFPNDVSPFTLPATPAPPAKPAIDEIAESPLHAVPEPPAWERPVASATPAQPSPFSVPAEPVLDPPSSALPEPSAWQPPFASEPAVPAAPFIVPPVGREVTHHSAAAWHEATGPTSPFGGSPPAPDQSTPTPTPAPAATAVPSESPSPAETAPPVDQDRVEELLRQFRERYSRSNP